MPEINDLFPSKWLVAADLEGKPCVLTIKKIEIETMKGRDGKADEIKPIVFFEEAEKGMVCNKTNATTISKLYGTNTDDWIGERITLFPTKVTWGKELVDAIRVDTVLPRKPKATANGNGEKKRAIAKPVTAPPETEDEEPGAESDIPF